MHANFRTYKDQSACFFLKNVPAAASISHCTCTQNRKNLSGPIHRMSIDNEHHMNFQMCQDAMITISMKKGVAVSSTNCLHVTQL
jgi:hypothetical protein